MDRVRNISKSMISYLKRAREHKEFLLKETKEFERGKRHLANMMNIKDDEMTQEDIDRAIRYLLPSGLFDKKARPMMKHPDILHRAQKDAQFDVEGRPYHYLFFTVLPNYHEALSLIGKKLRELDHHEDEQLAKGIVDPPEELRYRLDGRTWMSKEQLEEKFIETLSDIDYQYFIKSLEKLKAHPYSGRKSSFIEEFTKELIGQTLKLELPEVVKDEKTGEIYTDITTTKREHQVRVKTVLNGTGKFDLEGNSILYFDVPYMRQAIYTPLKMSGMQDKVDIYATFVRLPIHIGPGAIAGCIRQAVSMSIAAYCDTDIRSRLRLAGLLQPDVRRKERKKFGQEGARRKYTWKKR